MLLTTELLFFSNPFSGNHQPPTDTSLQIYEEDTLLKYRLKANYANDSFKKKLGFSLTTNQFGFRDRRSYSKKKRNILVLGDSMPLGWGVDDSASYGYGLAEIIKESNYQVVNTSLPGSGPVNQYYLLKRIYSVFQPEVILFHFYLQNDFRDSFLFNCMKYKDNEFKFDYHLHDPFFKRLARRFGTLKWLHSRLKFAISPYEVTEYSQQRSIDIWSNEWIFQLNPTPYDRKIIETSYDWMDSIANFAAENQSKLVLVIIPAVYQVYPEEFDKLIRQKYPNQNFQFDIDMPNHHLKQWIAENRQKLYRIIDLSEGFALTKSQYPLYIDNDIHWTPIGNKIASKYVSKQIADFIR